MTTLLMSGPMQSWGTRSRFTERDTEREPTKSGVVGLICAALGRGRDEPLDDVAALRMGVRVERPGTVQRDYQTALEVAKASGATPETLPSNRYYLADAAFLVGLEGDGELLAAIDAALRAPRFPLALGRRSYVAGYPIALPPGHSLVDASLLDALRTAPWPSGAGTERAVELVMDDVDVDSAEVRYDVPISFALGARRFAARRIRREQVMPTRTEGGES